MSSCSNGNRFGYSPVCLYDDIYTCIKTVSRFSSLFIPGKQINIKTQKPINHSNDVLLFQYFY